MTADELTQCLNMARMLNLVTATRRINGVLYVYRLNGQYTTWESFVSEYPLERLQAMINRSR
ncbi:MAG: hypothetical protein HC879_13385 [Leptolyngbyaceae cyanobacterium SL_5_9]|jgi:hypothetical protein|nr:hypothetical protein [Leptolyngbyaceae cyanobacterium SL_5_9]NJO66066.1 hypothetical protein [Leptolyngbyaceae cyanobacterium RM1_405_57]